MISRTYRTSLLAIIPLTASLIHAADDSARAKGTDKATAWPALEWKKAASSPFARVESPTAVVNGKLYLFGGFTEDLDASNQVDVYDPASDSWSRKKDMPTRLTHLNPAIDGNTIWFAGGFKGKHPGPVSAEVWKYDIAADTWTPGPPLPERRAGGGLAIVDRKLHYFGGYKADRDTNAADHWSLSLDGGKEWQHEADLPDPRGHVSATVLNGRIYALGGDHGHDVTQIDVPSCHRYDPATKKWSAIANLPDGRSHFESSTIIYKGRILIVGGRCNSSQPPRNVVNDLLQYDPEANTWQVVGTMPEKLLAPSAAIISGRLVVTGGGLNNPKPLTANTRIASLADDPIKHRLMVAEYGKGPNRLVELDADGKLVSEYKFPSTAVIFDLLPNGHVLYAFGGNPTGVAEIDRDKKTVWTYISKCQQVLGCERLPNGNTLIGEQGPCQAVEVDRDGKVVHTTKLTTTEEGYHLQVRNVHKLANGNILAAHEGEGAVREVDPEGKVVWEYKDVTKAGEARRLANGNTLIACGTQKRIIEVTPKGEIVWEFGAKDAPELNLTWISSLQILKNGNYVVGNFLRGQEGKGAHAFEVTRDKRVVWTFANHDLIKSNATVRVLDDK